MIDDCLNRTKVKRGSELSWSKLTEDDVRLINAAVDERNRLRMEAKQLSNKSLADKFGVSLRTMDRVTSGETWGHVV